MAASPRIDLDRLLGRLDTFNRIGALPGGGNCRLALSDDDRAGRDLLVQWMRELGLAVTIDAIGNIIGVRGGREDTAAVMFGSHVDTVGTGGRYDGLYGVLAGLEACQALNDAGIATRRPLALVAFTNEEGSRFPPYAMGSLVYVGGLALEDAYAIRGIDGATVGEELRRIGYVGDAKPGWLTPHAYLELHIEQGPILKTRASSSPRSRALPGSRGPKSRSPAGPRMPARRRCICGATRPMPPPRSPYSCAGSRKAWAAISGPPSAGSSFTRTS